MSLLLATVCMAQMLVADGESALSHSDLMHSQICVHFVDLLHDCVNVQSEFAQLV